MNRAGLGKITGVLEADVNFFEKDKAKEIHIVRPTRTWFVPRSNITHACAHQSRLWLAVGKISDDVCAVMASQDVSPCETRRTNGPFDNSEQLFIVQTYVKESM